MRKLNIIVTNKDKEHVEPEMEKPYDEVTNFKNLNYHN